MVIVGSDDIAKAMEAVSLQGFSLTRAVLQFTHQQIAEGDLPPTLAATLGSLPGLTSGATVALLCSGSTCQPPTSDPAVLRELL